jgi:hypothetical protein
VSFDGADIPAPEPEPEPVQPYYVGDQAYANLNLGPDDLADPDRWRKKLDDFWRQTGHAPVEDDR